MGCCIISWISSKVDCWISSLLHICVAWCEAGSYADRMWLLIRDKTHVSQHCFHARINRVRIHMNPVSRNSGDLRAWPHATHVRSTIFHRPTLHERLWSHLRPSWMVYWNPPTIENQIMAGVHPEKEICFACFAWSVTPPQRTKSCGSFGMACMHSGEGDKDHQHECMVMVGMDCNYNYIQRCGPWIWTCEKPWKRITS